MDPHEMAEGVLFLASDAATAFNGMDIDATGELPAASPPPLTETFDGSGDVDATAETGKLYFAACVQCHGANARGVIDEFGPPLAGASDWYLLTQLQNFKAGIRGTHPDDVTGAKMRPFSMTLANEQAMKDVIAYIGSLSE